jgi:hypothetical protein
MTKEQIGDVPPTSEAVKSEAEQKRTREISTISFPYGDLEDAIEVATALLEQGGVPCEPDQLAGAMKQTSSSGSFRQKIATARMFGVIETIQSKYQLTQLGFAITDQSRSKAAKADAFLNVPLYRKVYDTYRNQQLPPRPLALESAFVGFGVAQKQADKARVSFDASAQLAGFFELGGRDRLVRPAVGSSGSSGQVSQLENGAGENSLSPEREREKPSNTGGGGAGGGGQYHPFVQGLLETLPAPGTLWTIEGRAAWLEAAASAFKLIYKGDGKITITAADTQKQNGGHH